MSKHGAATHEPAELFAEVVYGVTAPRHNAVLVQQTRATTELEIDRHRILLVAYGPDYTLPLLRNLLRARRLGRSLDLIVIGGDSEARALLVRVQPRWQLLSLVGIGHIGNDSVIWKGPGCAPLTVRLLDDALRCSDEAPVDEHFHRELTERLAESAKRSRARRSCFTYARESSSPFSWLLSICAVTIFAFERAWGGVSIPTVVRMGANLPERSLHGEPWRLLSYGLIHGSWVHVLGNALLLFFLAPRLEKILGTQLVIFAFVNALLCGGLSGAIFSHGAISIGMSGGIWGLLGALLRLAFGNDDTLTNALRAHLRLVAIALLVLNVGFSFLPHISQSTHLGGLLSGWLVTHLTIRTHTLSRNSRFRSLLARLSYTALALALALAFVRGKPWALLDLPRWVAVPLRSPAHSAELPANLPIHRSPDRDSSAFRVDAGTLVDDLAHIELRIVATAPRTNDELASVADRLRDLPLGLDHPAYAVAEGPPTRQDIAGLPTVVQRFHNASPGCFEHWVQYRPNAIVSVQLSTWPAAAQAGLTGIAPHIFETLLLEPFIKNPRIAPQLDTE